MTKSEVLIVIAVFLIVNVTDTATATDPNEVFKDVNDKMFAAIDDLFIYLKVNLNFTAPNDIEDYMTAHSFIQDELVKKHKVYKEIHEIVKTDVSNEIADEISSINDALNGMIREETVTHNESFRNFSAAQNDDSVDLEKVFKIKFERIVPNNITMRGSNSSLQSQGRRIFAGKDTAIKRYPFMVSVHVDKRFVCAGSLLHESLALSAASCVLRTQEDRKAKVEIRIGSDYVKKQGTLVHIREILFHPGFDRSTLANNLAFLRTKRALRFVPQKVESIKYDKYDGAMHRDAKEIVILGWGRRSESKEGKRADKPLSRARLNMYDLEECKYIYTREYVTDTNFCAGFTDRGDGACNHDGGGPAVADSRLIGVISFGSPQCGRSDAPTVFTKLALYAEWIESVLDTAKVHKHEVPQFTVPASMEFGNDISAPFNIDDTEDDNPREVLKKEFGLLDVLIGPIDKGSKRPDRNTSLHKTPIMVGQYIPIMPEVMWPISPIVIELPPTPPVQSTQGHGEPISPSDIPLSVFLEEKETEEQIEITVLEKDSKGVKNSTTKIIETTTDVMEETEAFNIYDYDLASKTDTPSEPDGIEAVNDPTQTEKNDGNKSFILGESDGSDDSSECVDCQIKDYSENKDNKLENKVDEASKDLISKEKNMTQANNETAFILMRDSGTTKRIEVKRNNEMYDKVIKVMHALLKAVDNNNKKKDFKAN